jgi:hypothetical protein
MWESPITEAVNEIVGQIEKDKEDATMCSIKQTIGYEVDKEELIKALNYDRQQYEKGYKDAGEDLRAEIKELKKQIEIRTQEIVTYRAFAMLVMDMKKYGRLIDKEKAFDYIMEQCSKNFNGSGEVK